MQTYRWHIWCCVAVMLPLALVEAQEEKEQGEAKVTVTEPAEEKAPPPEDQETHEELIALRDRILKAYEAKDLDAVLAELHDDVVVTWQNAVVSRGHQGVREYYEDKIGRPDSIVKELKTKCVVDGYSQLYNDRSTAIAVGQLDDDFTLRDGKQFHLVSRWTATLVKQDEQWKIAAFHVSTDMFDNGVLHLYVSQYRNWAGGIGGVAGLAVGVLLGAMFFSRGRTTETQTGSTR